MGKIVGYMVFGAGEADKYLADVLRRNLPLVDSLVCWGDAPDRRSEEMVLRYPRVEYHRYHESIWGTSQNRIKEALLTRYVKPKQPDWCLCFDADEIFDKRITREKLEELSQDGLAYSFRFITLWDDEEHHRVDGGWGHFWNCRFFKFLPNERQEFMRRNVHCGLAPMYALSKSTDIHYLVKHYGYMNREHRQQKVERYKKFDPQKALNSPLWYDSMAWERDDKRMDVRPFNEDEFISRMPKYGKKYAQSR